MRRHLKGRRITLACFCLLACIFAGPVQADSLPMNLTICNKPVIDLSVLDLSDTGIVLLSYQSDIVMSFTNSCPSDYLMINSSASEIVLKGNLTHYCNPSLDCIMICIQGSTSFRFILLINILRNASYAMEFIMQGYSASIRELTSETAILPSFKNELRIRLCSEGSLISSPTFSISQSTKPDWFTFKQSTTAGVIYSTPLVDFEQLNGTTEVIVTIRGEQTLDNTGAKKLIAYTNLTVTILDVDDMNPEFTYDVYYLNISEATSGLSGNPYKTYPPIHAYDGDRDKNESIIYSIEDQMKNIFSINNKSGEISVLHELDADDGKNLYVMIIKATQEDNSFRTATSTLSLSVIDIDDNLPIFSPVNYICCINEHSAVGRVICSVTATDKDKGENAKFTYHFWKTSTVVEIDPNSGVIKVTDLQMLDREKETIIYVQVITKSTNGSTGNSTANVAIKLNDINDNSPEFNSSFPKFSAWNNSVGDFIGKANGNTSTSLYCSSVYPDSTTAPTSEATATGNISRPVVRPVIERLTSNRNQLIFHCDFDPLSDSSIMYQVIWYSDILVPESKLKSSSYILYKSREQFRSLTYLSEAHITLGMSIFCSITATKLNITSASVPYFAGFEMTSNKHLKLQYTEEALVYIRLTVPFGCRSQREECFLGVNMFYMERGADSCLLPVVAALSNCGVLISSWRWNESYALRLALKHGQNLHSISKTYNIKFKTDEHFDHDFFSNFTLNRDIKVEVTSDSSSLNGKECHAICDPHMQTFDGRFYENQNKGTYILYKHLKIPVQVQMRTNPCYGFQEGPPFCPCGVAVAAGRDVFVVDRCSIPFKIYMPQCDEGILQGKIQSDGNFYQIYLPSGSWMKITSGIFFNVYIYPSVSDRKSTSGLCGYLDSDVQNDFMLRNGTTVTDDNFEDFNSDWLVKPEEDLFNTSNYWSLPRWPREDFFCICEEYQHGRVFQSDNCSPDSRKFCPESALNDSLAADCNRRLTTNVNATIQLDPSDFNVSQSRHNTTTTKGNFTEDSANYECWSYLNSSLLFKKCSEVPYIVPESFANTCTKDALIANTMFWASTHLDNAQKKCIYQVTVNQPLPSNETTNETGVITSALLQELKDMACPMNCTDQGDCIKGQCLCYNGYGGKDCSVDLSKAPEVYGIPNRGVCDLHETSCEHASILGDNFADSPLLSCRLSLFQVKRNEIRFHDNSSIILKAKWISFAEVSCLIVDSRSKRSVEFHDDIDTLAIGYSVAVGNNREIFGRNVSLLIVDSLCVDCIKAGFDIACTLKDGFDLIDKRCIKTKSAEKEAESGSTVLIISTVMGSVLVVTVVCVIWQYSVIRRRRRAKYEKEIREAAYAELQETERQRENYSTIEEVYDEIRELPDDYLTPQNTIPTVGESENREGSYEKLSNAEKM